MRPQPPAFGPRRALVLALACAAVPPAALAAGTEDGLRAAFAGYVQAWTDRDAGKFAALLTEQVEWVPLYAQPHAGRDRVVEYAKTAMAVYALRFAVARVRLEEGGTQATLTFNGQVLEYPFRDGKYTRTWNREVLFSRWRFENGQWRIAYLNENAPQSAALAKQAGL